VITNSDATWIARHDYYPFGREVGASTDGETHKFTGKERDVETGLHYFGARYYHETHGRFMSPDEFTGGPVDAFSSNDPLPDSPLPYADITNPQSLNKYTYTYNNPLRYTDPNGHDIIFAENLKNAQLVKDSVQAILADPNTSSNLSGFVGPNNPNLIIQSGDLKPVLPLMVSRMAGLDGDESTAAGGTGLAPGAEFGLDGGAVVSGRNDAGDEAHGAVHRRGAQQADGVVGGDGAGRTGGAGALHQVPGGGPVGVAVEQRSDDAAVEHPGVSLMMRLRGPLGHDLAGILPHEAADAQSFFVGRTTAEADAVGRVGFLQAFLHGAIVNGAIESSKCTAALPPCRSKSRSDKGGATGVQFLVSCFPFLEKAPQNRWL
jgi:RHS repeat-associated protein